MTDLSLWLVGLVSRLLEPAEREAVLGDLLESSPSPPTIAGMTLLPC